jgi:hypothetical protein
VHAADIKHYIKPGENLALRIINGFRRAVFQWAPAVPTT